MPNVLPFQARTSPVRFAQDVRDALAGLAYAMPIEFEFGACDDGDETVSLFPLDADDFAFLNVYPDRDGLLHLVNVNGTEFATCRTGVELRAVLEPLLAALVVMGRREATG